ncbi:MAG: site-specific integrase, partial [Pseudomonadota bacterium]
SGLGSDKVFSSASLRVHVRALEKTLSLPKPDGWRGISYERYATLNVEDAIKFFGEAITLDDLSRDQIDAWCHSCEAKGNSDATINRKISALSKVMKVAIDYGGLEALPKMPRLRKERVGRIRFLTGREEDQVLQYMMQIGRHDISAFISALIDTGMRRSELLNVRPQDVDLKTGVIMVYGKEGKGTKNGGIRSVPMTQRVRGVMEGYNHGVTCFDLKESEIRHAWDAARAHMGLSEDKDFVLHACRHTCASRLVKAGVSLPVVKEWLGHSNMQTTMRYAHLFPQDLMNAAKALERMAAE